MKPFFEPYSAQQNAVEGLERHLRALEEKRKELLDVDSKRLVGNMNEGVFLVSAKNAFVPVKRDNSVNRISTVPRGSEQSE